MPGPAYHPPAPPLPHATAYREAGGSWAPARPADDIPRGPWWKIFHEPELDALVARLDIDNQTILAALERYRSARAQIATARSQYYPTVSVVPSVLAGRSSGALTGASTSPTASAVTGRGGAVGRYASYALPLEASWVPDLFGRVRYTVRQRRYSAQVSAADLESARLLAQATLVQTYLQLRGQDVLQDLFDETVRVNQDVVQLTEQRFGAGLENEAVVVQAKLTLENARVQAINAGKLRAQYEHAIATLLGVPATDFRIAKRARLTRVPKIPVGAPSQLLERRPDIASAERAMAAANANIGSGYAAFFPTVTLTGLAGFASTTLPALMSWPSRVWAFGAQAAETLFDGGLRRATIAQATADYRATVANYRQTVLVAFQEVEDGLSGARIVAREIEEQRILVALADRAFALEKLRYTAGLDPYVNLMLQQIALLDARRALVTLQVEQLTTAVQLVRALGGGWDRSQLPPP
jgi:NodT family efflux transporter outer membrane factor (OMF) lipoprotein